MKVYIGKYPKGTGDRKVEVRIDNQDLWSLDNTLALIIHPALVKMKALKHGSPHVDDEDVPEELRSLAEFDGMSTDDRWHSRWEWVMDEMIFAFEKIANGDWESEFYSGTPDIVFAPVTDMEGYSEMKRGPNDTFKVDYEGLEAMQARICNGTRLFGKYYQGLWD